MIKKIVMWAFVALVVPMLAAYIGGPVLGYDPLLTGSCALAASIVLGSIELDLETVGVYTLAAAVLGVPLAFVPQIPLWLEWLAGGAFGVAVALFVTLIVLSIKSAYNWVQTRAWH